MNIYPVFLKRLAVGLRLGLAFDDDREFQVAAGADQAAVGVMDEPSILRRFGFAEQNGDKRQRCPQSFGEAVFIVEQLGVIDVGALDVGRGAVGDGEQFLDGGLALALV